MESNVSDRNQLITLCQDKYKCELAILDEFEQTYASNKALWLYSRDSFVSRLLNQGFQAQIIDFVFFLHDIQEQLELNKCLSPVPVYRGQFSSNEELEI